MRSRPGGNRGLVCCLSLVVFAVGLVAAGCGGSDENQSRSSFETALSKDGKCILSWPERDDYIVPASEEITYFLTDGHAQVISGRRCTITTTEEAALAPAGKSAADTSEYLKIFWGAFSQLSAPNSYQDIEVVVRFSVDGVIAAPGSSYSAWLGLQPPISLKRSKSESLTAWRKENKWGNLAIHPTVQIGAPGDFTRVSDNRFSQKLPYIFNTFCDAGISTCPVDGPKNITTGKHDEVEVQQRVHRTGSDDDFPPGWVSSVKTDDRSMLFVVPDESIRSIFDNPDFCSPNECQLPVGLLEQEIRASKTIPLEEMPKLFPSEIEFRVKKIVQTDDNSEVKWSFPKSFEMTGKLVGDKVILSVDDLKSYLRGLDKDSRTYPPINCVHAILSQTKASRMTVDDTDVFLWKRNDAEPRECDPSSYQ